MIIRSQPLISALTQKARTHAHDGSRHLLCPSCGIRTKLYSLKDGRRKCSACGGKFDPEKKTDVVKLAQYADLLLCFCLNLTAQQTSEMTGYGYHLVSHIFDRFRMLLAAQNLTPEKLRLLAAVEACDHAVHDSTFCRRCRSRFDCSGRKGGDSPVFGMKIFKDGRIFIDPLQDDEAGLHVDLPPGDNKGPFSPYAGFICRGTFHRFTDNDRMKDGAERVWAWMSEKLKRHHGIWKHNAGLYLKELEWKYNHRLLTLETQALNIAGLMPADFLASWSTPDWIDLAIGVPAAPSR